MARVALEQLWQPLMSLRHRSGQGRHALLSLFARHDLPHAEGSRLFGEPCMLVTKKLLGPLCALAARGDTPQEGQEELLAGVVGPGALAFECLVSSQAICRCL